MEHLMMSHAKIGNAEPDEIAKFIVPYYAAMLKAMDGAGAAEPAGEGKTDKAPDKAQ
jgi:hypothetical protein